MTQFWRLEAPWADDYRRVFVNGEVRAAHALPDTGCRTCARPRGGDRVLPVDCPAEWRGRPEVTPHPRRQHRVANAEFEALRDAIAPALDPLPPGMAPVERGDRFQPLLLRVPSRPEADFLWPGVGDILVSERVRALWERDGVTGAVFSRVEYERVGRRVPTAALRGGGEPEDALRRLPADVSVPGLPAYYHVTITGESGLPACIDPAWVCAECGRPQVPASARIGGALRGLRFDPAMWRGADLCRMRATRYVVVTERVRAGLVALGATNVDFRPAEAEATFGPRAILYDRDGEK
jgi:hypothetical protein